MNNFNLTVLGLAVAFRAVAEPELMNRAHALVEERFDKLKSHGGQGNKDALLRYLVLSLACELLQAHKQLEGVQERIDTLLATIERNA